MFNTKNSIVVPYTTEQMFNLVNDVSSYSDFVPGCICSYVLVNNDYELTARIDVAKFGVNQSFITHNFIVRNKSIIIHLIDGPFKSLFGYWKFVYLSEECSRIEYYFNCEFRVKYIEKIFSFVFTDIMNDIIQAFVLRANKIYKYSK